MTVGFHDEMSRPSAGTVRPHHAQLFYTSWDDGSGSGGGWQVKDETGELSAGERDDLTARVVTRFDVGEPLPMFPTPADIAVRPARLSYAGVGDSGAGYWHTVDAGKDATGRPGNVAAHVVLDRQPSEPSPLRPIELWGSAGWLRPYGATEVAAAQVNPSAIPVPNTEITAANSIEFINATMERQNVFRVMLDAVAAALSGGPRVALAVSDLDSGPRWIAAISFFMSPGTARRLWWSTYDDPLLAAADLRRGVHLVVLSRDRIKELPAGSWVSIDEAEEPDIGALGGTHGIAGGAVPVSAWSVLAEGVLGDEVLAARLLADQDRIASEVGDTDLSPVWPLAVAVRRDVESAQFHGNADQVIAEEAPQHPIEVDWIAAVVNQAIAATAPTTASEACQRLVVAQKRGYGVAAAALWCLRIGLTDPIWLTSTEFGEVPQLPVVQVGRLHEAVTQLLALPASAPVSSVGVGLRGAELLSRLGVRDAALSQALAVISAALTDLMPAVLGDPSAAAVLAADALIGDTTREEVLRPAVAAAPAPVLDAIGLPLWWWLFGDTPNALPTIAPNPYPFDGALVPRYAVAALDDAQRHSLWTTQEAARLAIDAIYLALDTHAFTDDQCRALVSRLAHYTRLAPADLQTIFTRWPSRVAPGIAVSCVFFEKAPTELVELIGAVGSDSGAPGWDGCTVAAARLRALTRAPLPWRDEQIAQAQTQLSLVLANIPRDHVRALADDLADVLAALVVAARSRGTSDLGGVDELADDVVATRLGRKGSAAADMLGDLAQAGALDIEWLFGQALLARIAAAVPELNGVGAAWAGPVVSDVVAAGKYRGPATVAEVRDACWPQVRTLGAEAAEAFFAGYPEVAREWLSDNGIGDIDKPRLGFRRFS